MKAEKLCQPAEFGGRTIGCSGLRSGFAPPPSRTTELNIKPSKSAINTKSANHPMKTTNTIVTAFLLALAPVACLASQGTEIKPILAKPAKPIADDAFTGTALAKIWSVSDGDWQIHDGTLVGKEKAEQKHAAVCNLKLPSHDSIIRFSFKLDGAKGVSLSYNHAKGHLFRVNVLATGINVRTDRVDPNPKGVQICNAEAKFETGQWYTMQVEVKSQKVAVQTDNGVKIEGTNPSLDVDKTEYRFVANGESLVLADVKAWEVAP